MVLPGVFLPVVATVQPAVLLSLALEIGHSDNFRVMLGHGWVSFL